MREKTKPVVALCRIESAGTVLDVFVLCQCLFTLTAEAHCLVIVWWEVCLPGELHTLSTEQRK